MKLQEKFGKIDDDDVEDLVGIASEMMQEDDETLDRATMLEVGRDLDIPEAYLDRAYTELQKRRKDEARQQRREEGRRRRFLTLGGTGLAGVIFMVVLWGMFSISSLSKLHASVELQESRVKEVVERKQSVEVRWGDRPDSPDKMAALDGSDNRIAVETRRYSEAAANYNAKAERFPNSLFLTFSSLPDSVSIEPDRN